MEQTEKSTRRQMILQCTCTVGAFAFTGFFRAGTISSATEPLKPPDHFAPRAKAVINFFLSGGPSQMDTFDYKPSLAKNNGKPLPFKTPVMSNAIANTIFESPFRFTQHGQSGMWVSELLPGLAECVDDLTVIHSMYHSQPDHLTARCFASTGYERAGRPSLGAWVMYGLRARCEGLPGFVSLNSGGQESVACGFLPPEYQATAFQSATCPMADLQPRESSPELQQSKRAFLRRMNRWESEIRGRNPLMDAADSCFDQALRMQTSVPELYDLKGESQQTLALYGISNESTRVMGTQCLIARRLIERGVRYVHINSDGWDHHANLTASIRKCAQETDRPIAGLLKDLKQRGLLGDTLVLWGGEFGRTPIGTNGREHNPHGYTVWLAGGGTRAGLVYGATDEFGYFAEQKKVRVHDLHATILHLLGLDHNKLTYRFGGRDFKLTDIDGEVVEGILA